METGRAVRGSLGEVASHRVQRYRRTRIPGRHRRVRGLERRGRGGQRGGQPPGHRLAGDPYRRHRPRGLLRFPGQPAGGRDRGRTHPAADLADDQDLAGPRPPGRRAGNKHGAAHRAVPRRGPGARHRAEHALAGVQRGTGAGPGGPWRGADHPARRAARRCAAHPPGAGIRRLVELQARRRGRRRPGGLQGPHRDRRGAAAHLRRSGHPGRLAVGAGPALRGAAAQSEGHAGAAARRRGHPGRTAAAGRPARGGAGLGARRGRARPAGLRGRRLRAHPGRGQGRDGPARGERRRDRPRVRALLQAPRRRRGVVGSGGI